MASNSVCRYCKGILDYIYHTYFRCRECGTWHLLKF